MHPETVLLPKISLYILQQLDCRANIRLLSYLVAANPDVLELPGAYIQQVGAGRAVLSTSTPFKVGHELRFAKGIPE